MKTNNIKNEMQKRVSSTRWSEADTFHVLQKITEEEPAVAKRRMPAALSAALVLVLLLAVTALAESQWGLLHWFSNDQPAEAIVTVKPDMIYKRSCDIADIELTEAASDGYGLYINMRITPKDPKALFVNLHPDNPVSMIGVHTDDPMKTIGDWAEEQGYRIYDFDVDCGQYSLKENGLVLTGTPASFDSYENSIMQLNDDGSFNLLLSGTDLGPGNKYRLYCSFWAYRKDTDGWWEWDQGSDSKHRTTIWFTVPEDKILDSRVIARYVPETSEDPSDDDYAEVQEMKIVNSALSSYVVTRYTLTEKGRAHANEFYKPPAFYLDGDQYTFYEMYPSYAKGEMYSWKEISGGEQPVYEFCYSRSLPDPIPDKISLDAHYWHIESVPNGNGDWTMGWRDIPVGHFLNLVTE